MIYLILSAIISYLVGSISSAIIISKTFYDTDIRKTGSKNAGATNTLRAFGKKAGATVFIFDFSKGLLCALAAKYLVYFLNAPYECVLVAGFFVQLGHIFPLFFKFKGGKGVATAAGAALAIMPAAACILLGLFAVIIALTKTVSLASGICAAVYPLLALFRSGANASANFVFAATCAVMIAVKHAPNFARLLDGEEKKISFKRKKE